MSSGEFTNAFYEISADNGGGTCNVRVQPETLTLEIASVTNASAAGPADQAASAKVSKGNGEIGVGCRAVNLEFTGTPPTDYSGDNVIVPVLTVAAFAAYTKNATGTYLGAPVRVAGRRSESVV